MDLKHLATIVVGVACVTIGALVPATAPVLLPVGGALLLASDPRQAMGRKTDEAAKK